MEPQNARHSVPLGPAKSFLIRELGVRVELIHSCLHWDTESVLIIKVSLFQIPLSGLHLESGARGCKIVVSEIRGGGEALYCLPTATPICAMVPVHYKLGRFRYYL